MHDYSETGSVVILTVCFSLLNWIDWILLYLFGVEAASSANPVVLLFQSDDIDERTTS